MPTGYTARVMNGSIVNPIEYIKICARSCGVLEFMKEEPLDTPIPTQTPSDLLDYYKGELDALRVRRYDLLQLTWDELTAMRQADYEKRCKLYQEHRLTCAVRRMRYWDMLHSVQEWDTGDNDDLSDLKRFAIGQLEKSLDCDCDDRESVFPAPMVMTNQEWLDGKLADIDQEIELYKKWLEEEEEKLRTNQEWLGKFHKSLEEFDTARSLGKKAEGNE